MFIINSESIQKRTQPLKLQVNNPFCRSKINQLLLEAVDQSNVKNCYKLLENRTVDSIPIEEWHKINFKVNGFEIIYPMIHFARKNGRQDLLSIFIGSRSGCLGDFLLDAIDKFDLEVCAEILNDPHCLSIPAEKWLQINAKIVDNEIVHLVILFAHKNNQQDLLVLLIGSRRDSLGHLLLDAVDRSNLEVCFEILKDQNVCFIPIKLWHEIGAKIADTNILYLALHFACENQRRDIASIIINSYSGSLGEVLLETLNRSNPTVYFAILNHPNAGSIPLEMWRTIKLQVKDPTLFYPILRCASKTGREDVLSLFIGSYNALEYMKLCLLCLNDLVTLTSVLHFVTKEHLPGHNRLAILYWANQGDVGEVTQLIDEGISTECYETISYLLDAHDFGEKKGKFLYIVEQRSSKWINRKHAEEVLARVSPLSF